MCEMTITTMIVIIISHTHTHPPGKKAAEGI